MNSAMSLGGVRSYVLVQQRHVDGRVQFDALHHRLHRGGHFLFYAQQDVPSIVVLVEAKATSSSQGSIPPPSSLANDGSQLHDHANPIFLLLWGPRSAAGGVRL